MPTIQSSIENTKSVKSVRVCTHSIVSLAVSQASVNVQFCYFVLILKRELSEKYFIPSRVSSSANPSSILKGCDYKKLLKVPMSFASIDEFYQVFLPMKMMQIWNEVF